MQYQSDYLGRMQWIIYPDGEKIIYGYDEGGQVTSVEGSHYNQTFPYVTKILYDQYGQRTRIEYGNGTYTDYTYNPERRWLETVKTKNKYGQSYQNIRYDFDRVGNVRSYVNDCMDTLSGNYKTDQSYEYDDLYQLIHVTGNTEYYPAISSVPDYKSTYTQDFAFDDKGLGNMMSKVSKETVSPLKVIGDNLNYNIGYVYDENYAHRLVQAGNRYYKYDANGNIICEQDGSFDGSENDVSYYKVEQHSEDVYSTDNGWGLFKDESSEGRGQTHRYRRTYTWNSRNQLVSSVDANYSTSYVYGQDGQRSNKYTQGSETLYFNKMWTLHTDNGNSVYGGQYAKNVYLGETRIVTKLARADQKTAHEETYKQYYYHSDHLGSASMISDWEGKEYQRIEYTPYGETWVEKTSNSGSEFLPYKFTGKEVDQETGLYYYGARYLDPKYSMWISTDPALGECITDSSKSTSGGIYNSKNFNLYHYANNNPIKFTDPNGKDAYLVIWASSNTETGHAAFAVDNYKKVTNDDGSVSYVPDGTVTFYELGPLKGIDPKTEANKNVPAKYKKIIVNKSDLFTSESLSRWEDTKADGIIKFSTDKKTDDKTKKKLDTFMSSSDKYNAQKRNCSDMGKVGVQSSKKGFKFGLGKERYLIFSFTTPNSLFNDSKDFSNSTVLLDPGTKTDYSFSDGWVKRPLKQYLGKDTNED